MPKQLIGSRCGITALLLGAASVWSAPTPPSDRELPELPGWVQPDERSPTREIVRESLRRQTPPFEQNPLKHLELQSVRVIDWLDEGRSDNAVQEKQRLMIAHLREMIAALERQRSHGGGGEGGGQDQPGPAAASPEGPANASTLAPGPGGEGALRRPGDSQSAWGELPPRERERILQTQEDGFPADYEAVLEDYFRRLAQEQVVESMEDPPPMREREQ